MDYNASVLKCLVINKAWYKCDSLYYIMLINTQELK